MCGCLLLSCPPCSSAQASTPTTTTCRCPRSAPPTTWCARLLAVVLAGVWAQTQQLAACAANLRRCDPPPPTYHPPPPPCRRTCRRPPTSASTRAPTCGSAPAACATAPARRAPSWATAAPTSWTRLRPEPGRAGRLSAARLHAAAALRAAPGGQRCKLPVGELRSAALASPFPPRPCHENQTRCIDSFLSGARPLPRPAGGPPQHSCAHPSRDCISPFMPVDTSMPQPTFTDSHGWLLILMSRPNVRTVLPHPPNSRRPPRPPSCP